MRYAIGCRQENSQGIKVIDGFFGFDRCGFSKVLHLSDVKVFPEIRIPIFDDLESAQEYVTRLSKSHRQEYKEKLKKYNGTKDINKWFFYLLKWDCLKFSNIELKNTNQKVVKKGNTYYNGKLYTISMK